MELIIWENKDADILKDIADFKLFLENEIGFSESTPIEKQVKENIMKCFEYLRRNEVPTCV